MIFLLENNNTDYVLVVGCWIDLIISTITPLIRIKNKTKHLQKYNWLMI